MTEPSANESSTGAGAGDAAAKAEFAKLLGSRSGGAYIPPARLRMLQAEASKDKRSAEYQRLSWDALRKSINGLINKVSLVWRLGVR
jgi:pre-mRNA-splicing factor CWC22